VNYDALLLVSFGGPERNEDVIPFLENVLRGKNVPRERMLEVAEHYYHFNGKSPINQHNRELMAALKFEMTSHGLAMPVYWGNRNWHPLLPDTLRRMREDGVRRALALATSAFGSYSGCRQYRENLEQAAATVGPGAPEIHKLRTFHDHPSFIRAMADYVLAALAQVPESRRSDAALLYTAHSIPVSMAETSPYVGQLLESCRLVSQAVGHAGELVYQSRSGPPAQPWLEPDVCARIRQLHASGGLADAVLAPVGFLSDHMEVLYDLDTEAAVLCRELGINMVRASTAGLHPAFVSMVGELVLEQTHGVEPRRLGTFGAACETCGPNCCPAPRRLPVRSTDAS
jgi:ferrochelatase